MKTEILEFPQKTLLEETSFWSFGHSADSGNIDINIRTKTNLANTVTVLVYATYSSEIVIDDSGNVIMTKAF